MASTQSMTRRALFTGAAATIVAANVAGTAAVAASDPYAWWTPEMWRWQADGVIHRYLGEGVQLILQPDGRLAKHVYVDEGPTDYEAAVIDDLDQRLRASPRLRQAVIARLRDLYGPRV